MVSFDDMAKKFTDEEFQQFVIEQFGLAGEERRDMRSEISELHRGIEEIKATVEPLARAFDVDAEAVVEHNRRIGRIEAHLGFRKRA